MDSAELRLAAGESERRLALLTPARNLRNAALLREVMPKLKTTRQRELAEEMAKGFEQRAFARSRPE